MKALLTNYRQAPRKVRLVANLIRNKSVPAARVALSYLPKKSAPTIAKLLDSAVANAGREGVSANDLFVRTITVDKGLSMARHNPNKHNMSARLHKVASIVKIELGTIIAHTPVVKKTKITK